MVDDYNFLVVEVRCDHYIIDTIIDLSANYNTSKELEEETLSILVYCVSISCFDLYELE